MTTSSNIGRCWSDLRELQRLIEVPYVQSALLGALNSSRLAYTLRTDRIHLLRQSISSASQFLEEISNEEIGSVELKDAEQISKGLEKRLSLGRKSISFNSICRYVRMRGFNGKSSARELISVRTRSAWLHLDLLRYLYKVLRRILIDGADSRSADVLNITQHSIFSLQIAQSCQFWMRQLGISSIKYIPAAGVSPKLFEKLEEIYFEKLLEVSDRFNLDISDAITKLHDGGVTPELGPKQFCSAIQKIDVNPEKAVSSDKATFLNFFGGGRPGYFLRVLLIIFTAATASTVLLLYSIVQEFPVLAIVIPLLSLDWSLMMAMPIFSKRVPSISLPSLPTDDPAVSDTWVCVCFSTIVDTVDTVDSLIEHLTAAYKENGHSKTKFVLLVDAPDAAKQTESESIRPVVLHLMDKIDELNRIFSGKEDRIFYALYRDPVFCATQDAWIGRERKHGKICDFLRFLCSKADSFSSKSTGCNDLLGIEYVMLVDDDSVLSPGVIESLLAVARCPTNWPISDDRGQVLQGYSIFCPQSTISRDAVQKLASRLLVNGRVATDVVQPMHNRNFFFDTFSIRQYSGKGLIDVESFLAAQESRFPAERLLSHDTMEGAWAGTAHVATAELQEGFPSTQLRFAERSHRWARGDWQNLTFLLSKKFRSAAVASPSLWTAVSYVCFLCIRHVGRVLYGTFFVCAIFLMRPADFGRVGLCFSLLYFCSEHLESLTSLPSLRRNLGRLLLRYLAHLALIPFQTGISLDALLRSIFRLSRGRRLLDWKTSRESERTSFHIGAAWLWISAAIGAAALAHAIIGSDVAAFSLLVATLWTGSPYISRAL